MSLNEMSETTESGTWVTYHREFVPTEATLIADEYWDLAKRIAGLSISLRSVMNRLDRTWSGKAKAGFFNEYKDEPVSIDFLSQAVEEALRRMRNIRVVQTERVFEPYV